jgi:uncharacterized protein YeaO (DUF488 family)
MREKYNLQVKRIYDPYQEGDGYRILVDRLWPRGVSKEKAHLNLWLKEIAPSDELRRWFHHEEANWQEFTHRYLDELETHPDEVSLLLEKIRQTSVTLLYGARDTEHNQALILKDYLEKHNP